MGEVWQARDTKLDRDVALKVLPEAFTADPERLARFEREAKVLASLNHPNIGSIYGLEEAEGGKFRALVLELVEGPTLADRIAHGPIPIDEALPIAKQIAEALEAAHERGVIHRDLKPANVKVKNDGTVKVLDFGLAKAFQPEAGGASASMSPTISLTAAATQMGMVIGTAAYMAPEQAKGKPVDKRAEVWAFGAVLYEMLTGRKAFRGEDVSDTLATVLKFDPDWDALPSDTPPSVRRLLRRSLAKDPKLRLREAGSAILEINESETEPDLERPASPSVTPQLHVWQRPVPAAIALLVASLVAGGGVWTMLTMLRPDIVPTGLVRFAIVPPDTAPLRRVGLLRDLAISPDGTQVVYVSSGPDESGSQLNLRPIDQLTGAPLRGGEDAAGPFVSPAGEWVGFVDLRGTTLQKVSIFGGPPVTLAQSPGGPIVGASWGVDDQIIFGTREAGLFRVSGGGGEPEALTQLDTEQGEANHTWPFIIPGREAVVFVIGTGAPLTTGQLAVLDLATGEVTRLGLAGVSPHYVSTGHLVYAAEDGSVRAVPFDATSLDVTGTPVPVIEPSAAYATPRLSPDGQWVAVTITSDDDRNADIWVIDAERGSRTRLTSAAEADRIPVWTPDGDRVTFASARDGTANSLYSIPSDGSGTAERLTEADSNQGPTSWSPDGSTLAFYDVGGTRDIFTVTPGEEPVRFLETSFREHGPVFSPDGQWLAYTSDETGRFEVYLTPYPGPGGKTPISVAGGRSPIWRADGRELFYRRGDDLFAVAIATSPSLRVGAPELLFTGSFVRERSNQGASNYDVAPDGQRFLMLSGIDQDGGADAPPPQITVVLNWFEELKERGPVP